MTPWMLVRSTRLRERALVCGQASIRRATLLPFFDRAGSVAQVMIVDADSSDLRTFKVDRARARIPTWGAIRIEGLIDTLDEFVIDQLAGLWHFDPWWLLRDERFRDNAVIPILQSTNCAEVFDEQPASLLFSGCLTELRKVRFAAPSENYENRQYCDEMLPLREPTPLAGRKTRSAGWRLAPVWRCESHR